MRVRAAVFIDLIWNGSAEPVGASVLSMMPLILCVYGQAFKRFFEDRR